MLFPYNSCEWAKPIGMPWTVKLNVSADKEGRPHLYAVFYAC